MSEQNTVPAQMYPVGMQDFEYIRQDNFYYVDKTAYIYQLAQSSKYIFLSRPRRFGKSLLCSTIKYYFAGRRDLFRGLAIEQLEKDWTEYPVIHLSLNAAKDAAPEKLSDALWDELLSYDDLYGPCRSRTIGGHFGELIRNAYAQTGKRVVVIIDEYDAPLLTYLNAPEALSKVRQVMQEFYSPLKNADPYLRFCFITGITKFSQLSIFSTINNLKNISMLKPYAAICGITETELHQTFGVGVEKLSQALNCSVEACYARLKEEYDGYHFAESSEDIYNPFSLLRALDDSDVMPYWFETGTPTYLIHTLKQYNTDLSQVDGVTASVSQFNIPTEAMSSALPLLYQSGYLTIKGYDPMMRSYVLGLPNNEVRVGLSECLLPVLSEVNVDTMNGIQYDFCKALLYDDLEAALTSMRSYFAAIPYPEGGKELLEKEEYAEWHYSRIFFLLFSFMNRNIHTEVKSARGRADMVMYTAHTIYVFEFKVNHSASEALKQIDEKGYMVPYEADARKLVKCGVEFSSKLRTLKEWKVVEEKRPNSTTHGVG
jgi:hypothetical protein